MKRVIMRISRCVGGLLALGLLAAGCQTATPRVKVALIAEGCVTNGFIIARHTNSDAISAAGFLPVILPRIADTNLLAAAMDQADALVLTGSLQGNDFPVRVAFEHMLMRMALDRGLPVVGFCHGHQTINTYFGGKVGRIPSDLTPAIVHRGKESPYVKDCFHMVNVAPGSRLAEGLGATRFEVNTSHRFHITELGEGLEVTARADDGVIEAVEHRTLPVTGFQFHPERIFRRDPHYLRIIRDALEHPAARRAR